MTWDIRRSESTSKPLAALTRMAFAAIAARRDADNATHFVRRHRDHRRSGAGERRYRIVGRIDTNRDGRLAQIAGVPTCLAHLPHQTGIARPQPDVVARARQVHRERGTPASGAKHGNRVGLPD